MAERLIMPDARCAARSWVKLKKNGLFLNAGTAKLLMEINPETKYLKVSISEDGQRLYLEPSQASMKAFRIGIYRSGKGPYGIVYSQKLIKEIGWAEGVYEAYREGERLAVKREG